MQSIYQKLIDYWTIGGLKISAGCSQEEISGFESKNGVLFPEDFRNYLLHVDGMVPVATDDCDENGFSFWTLARIKNVVKEFAQHSSPIPKVANADQYFVFADYLQWSWAYAIQLTNHLSESNQIIHVGTLRPKVIARSFTEFVELYLRDAEDLYAV